MLKRYRSGSWFRSVGSQIHMDCILKCFCCDFGGRVFLRRILPSVEMFWFFLFYSTCLVSAFTGSIGGYAPFDTGNSVLPGTTRASCSGFCFSDTFWECFDSETKCCDHLCILFRCPTSNSWTCGFWTAQLLCLWPFCRFHYHLWLHKDSQKGKSNWCWLRLLVNMTAWWKTTPLTTNLEICRKR